MKKRNLIWIAVLFSLLLVIAGCGDKEESRKAVEAEEVSQNDSSDSDAADQLTDEDKGVQDLGSDVTEDAVSGEEDESEDAGSVSGEETDEESEDYAAESDDQSSSEEDIDTSEDASDESDDALPAAETYKVISIKDLKAYPEEIHIKVGTTVEWRNVNDNLQHIIGWSGQKQEGIKPEPILAGESWSYTFNKPGKIVWFSTAKPTLQGTIFIEE